MDYVDGEALSKASERLTQDGGLGGAEVSPGKISIFDGKWGDFMGFPWDFHGILLDSPDWKGEIMGFSMESEVMWDFYGDFMGFKSDLMGFACDLMVS